MTDEQIRKIRDEFPIFGNVKQPFIYMDNAATTQKPKSVLERVNHFYSFENANIHRGLYPLSTSACNAFEGARETVRSWIDAEKPEEIVFTKSSTEAVNLTATALFETTIQAGDNVIVTEMEHSSNYFPWKHQCAKNGCEFRTALAEETGEIREESIFKLADDRTKLIAVTGMSNAIGFMPDLKSLICRAHEKGILVFVDATQLIAHRRLSVKELSCDFLCFSGHKLYAPMGIGVLYGRETLLTEMSPFLYGGDMVEIGDGREILFREDPGKYEAGTQNIAGALGLEAAIRFLEDHHFETELLPYEKKISSYLNERLSEIPGLTRNGPSNQVSSIYNFTMKNCGAYDVGIFLATSGIAVRSGAHCAYPLMQRMKQESNVRISLSFCNTEEEVDLVADRLRYLSGTVYLKNR